MADHYSIVGYPPPPNAEAYKLPPLEGEITPAEREIIVRTGGIILPAIPNYYDPYTQGLPGPVGAQVETLDGTKAWLKYGTANTAWRAIHRLEAGPVTAAGGPVTLTRAQTLTIIRSVLYLLKDDKSA